jgi:hypothetical protein
VPGPGGAKLLFLFWPIGDRNLVRRIVVQSETAPYACDASALLAVNIRGEPKKVIHMLIVAAVILFVLWLLFHATGALVNLLWIGIVVLAILWLVGLFRSRRSNN